MLLPDEDGAARWPRARAQAHAEGLDMARACGFRAAWLPRAEGARVPRRLSPGGGTAPSAVLAIGKVHGSW